MKIIEEKKIEMEEKSGLRLKWERDDLDEKDSSGYLTKMGINKNKYWTV